ncbi:hypothetical protein K402DRAFT_405235 [Aulographum hederae CBS 113979]|uniref:Uncharacterized protein n=1 Tax=Aulographum hederae CBS 113979 TaxID=1176131 RepID=A0A6G1GWX3_9PEZI|nr:hypothetical protein K402DRAFT_405235 [Aulographum hederae CBS 113979]
MPNLHPLASFIINQNDDKSRLLAHFLCDCNACDPPTKPLPRVPPSLARLPIKQPTRVPHPLPPVHEVVAAFPPPPSRPPPAPPVEEKSPARPAPPQPESQPQIERKTKADSENEPQTYPTHSIPQPESRPQVETKTKADPETEQQTYPTHSQPNPPHHRASKIPVPTSSSTKRPPSTPLPCLCEECRLNALMRRNEEVLQYRYRLSSSISDAKHTSSSHSLPRSVFPDRSQSLTVPSSRGYLPHRVSNDYERPATATGQGGGVAKRKTFALLERPAGSPGLVRRAASDGDGDEGVWEEGPVRPATAMERVVERAEVSVRPSTSVGGIVGAVAPRVGSGEALVEVEEDEEESQEEEQTEEQKIMGFEFGLNIPPALPSPKGPLPERPDGEVARRPSTSMGRVSLDKERNWPLKERVEVENARRPSTSLGRVSVERERDWPLSFPRRPSTSLDRAKVVLDETAAPRPSMSSEVTAIFSAAGRDSLDDGDRASVYSGRPSTTIWRPSLDRPGTALRVVTEDEGGKLKKGDESKDLERDERKNFEKDESKDVESDEKVENSGKGKDEYVKRGAWSKRESHPPKYLLRRFVADPERIEHAEERDMDPRSPSPKSPRFRKWAKTRYSALV